MVCEQVVGFGDEAACAGQLSAYVGDGYCSGMKTDASTTFANDCSMLASCCNGQSFPASELTGCEGVVGEGDAYACAGQLSVWQHDGTC
jgi:hypothetical protein